jgi:F-type H+-transporting ATPase subunit delta
MAELATIARPYAEALFKACSGDLDGTTGWLDQLASVAGSPQLLEFAANPKVPPEQVFGLIAGLSKQPLPDAGKNFLRAVIDNGRLAALPEVALQFRALRNARSGSADAVVYSAFPIDEAGATRPWPALERRFGAQAERRGSNSTRRSSAASAPWSAMKSSTRPSRRVSSK